MATKHAIATTIATLGEVAPDLIAPFQSALAIAGIEASRLATDEAARREAYAPVADANARVAAAKIAYSKALAAWRMGDEPALVRREAARIELDAARDAARLALSNYTARTR